MSDNDQEEITLTLTLTREEWCEVANAISSKASLVSNGFYEGEEEEGDDERWSEVLNRAYDKLAVVLEEHEVVY